MRALWAVMGVMIAVVIGGHASAADLTVIVSGVRGATGSVRICVFGGPRGFPDCTAGPAIQRRGVQAAKGNVRAVFSGLPPGTYAVTAFHDEKNAGRVETNFLGIPRSGVGATNDPVTRFGSPTFQDAAFTLPDEPATVTVTLRYP